MVDLVCVETFEAKPTQKYLGFITCLDTIYFSWLWLDNRSYLINQLLNYVKHRLPLGTKSGDNKEIIQGGGNNAKGNILNLQEKQ